MTHVRYATAAAPGGVNEDYVIAGPSWVVVLDGATAPRGIDSGCVHDVPWLVRTLATALAARLDGDERLPDVLAGAIAATVDAHAATCDLDNPNSPSATVAIARRRGDLLDHLVLCDSAVGLRRRDGTVSVTRDDRLEHLPGGRPYSMELVASQRNRPGGFWVASTCPEAASRALTGSAPVPELCGVALFTDGVTRLADWYGHPWRELVGGAARDPAALLELVRQEERAHGTEWGKAHDDATAAWMSLATT
ncbi:protein phosphatase 2C domain-containing protein [Nonomuraea sp. LPB2021202275-12-8]|uniref:protein phosphatase 2C domain-containing protein n=1 Tax=Nonomuraea sp. LPB2021202275-12-8 TaxID=3120159 RepID=UPI00300D366B